MSQLKEAATSGNGPNPKCRHVSYLVAVGGKADVTRTSPDDLV